MPLLKKNWFVFSLFAVLVLAVYFPTVTYEYVLDDKIVFTDNKFVKEGFAGISKIMGGDSFEGYFGEQKDILPGSRYRPLSLVTFALEYQFFGTNKFVSHGLNILFYFLCSCILFITLRDVFGRKKFLVNSFFFLIATILFIVHPIHSTLR